MRSVSNGWDGFAVRARLETLAKTLADAHLRAAGFSPRSLSLLRELGQEVAVFELSQFLQSAGLDLSDSLACDAVNLSHLAKGVRAAVS